MAGARGLPVALRPGRQLLALLARARPDENYLRGVQETDANGTGHVHQHLPGLLLGPLAPHPLRGLPEPGRRHQQRGNKIATSQIALPEDTCKAVYATAGYEQSVANLSQVTLASDNVFGDGCDLPDRHHDRRPHQGLRPYFRLRGLIPTLRARDLDRRLHVAAEPVEGMS